MLEIIIPQMESFNEEDNTFVYDEEVIIQLEHSLVAISKWESKWRKPFLSDTNKTIEELTDYIKCMTITENVAQEVYARLTSDNIRSIDDYIESPMTATTFSNEQPSKNKSIITSELIYYWMIAYTIPFECQHWHLNRLLTLIKVCNAKNEQPKKMSKAEIAERNRQLNRERRNKLNSSG